MNKKRLGNDPLDDLDILSGPEKRDSKTAGKKTSQKTGNGTSQKAGRTTSHKTSQISGNMTSHNADNMASQETSKKTSHMTGNMTSHGAVVLDIPAKSKLRKMTYYFREDQLKELDKLSKKTGRDRSELARMAIDLLLNSVQKK